MQENINLKDGYYKFFKEHKSWKEAESFCNTYGVNVHLASIKVQFYIKKASALSTIFFTLLRNRLTNELEGKIKKLHFQKAL